MNTMAPRPSDLKPHRNPLRIAWALLLAYALATAILSARPKSITADEAAHIGAGISFWLTRDFRMNPEHPPLVKAIAGASAIVGGAITGNPIQCVTARPQDGAVLASWEDGEQNAFGNILIYQQNDANRLLFFARIVPILIGLAGALLAAAWTRQLGGGAWAQWAAAAFLLLYPEWMGHARWVTFDIPTAVACAAASLALMRWWQKPSLPRAALFAAAATAAALTKFTAAVYLGLLAAGACAIAIPAAISRLCRPDTPRPSARPSCRPWLRRRSLLHVALLFAASALLVWAAFWAACDFRFSMLSPDQPALTRPNPFLAYAPDGQPQSGLARYTYPLWRHRIVPETFCAMINHTGSFAGRATFLNGRTSRVGFPDYFLWTTLYKTPLLYLAGAIAAAAFALPAIPRTCRTPRHRQRILHAAAFYLLPLAALLLLTASSRANLGHRYILFIYIPWSIALGLLAGRAFSSPRPLLRWAAAAAIVLSLAVHARQFPNYSSYFNLIAGGRDTLRASQLLLDSNVDWGQDLPALARHMRQHDIHSINLAYFGFADPRYYGIIDFRQILPSYQYAINMPPFQPLEPAWFTAISLNNLQSARLLYPGAFEGPPAALLNSIAIYPPIR